MQPNNNKYTTDQFQMFLQKKKQTKSNNKHSSIDDEILERASKIEQETYSIAKQANTKLKLSANKQKLTTEHLIAQGEKLSNVKQGARSVNSNVKQSHQLTKEIKEESKIFRIPFIHSIKNFLTTDKKVKEHGKKREKQKDQNENESTSVIGDNDKNMDNTDKELNDMLNTLKGMRKETKSQRREIHRQKSDIDDIVAYNKNTEYYMDKANKEMKDL